MSKFSKKKFKGLDSIFENDNELQDEQTIVAEEKLSPGKKVERIKAKGTNKNFTSDLDTLLEQALLESEYSANNESRNEKSDTIKGGIQTVSGLDALIRQTISFETAKPKKGQKPTKRVTLTVDKEKLNRLKQIARTKNSFLKDIITKLISDYIVEYETQKP